MSNITTFQGYKEKQVYTAIERYQEQIKRLVKVMPLEQFMQNASLLIKSNAAIASCSAESVIGALLEAATLQLNPSPSLGNFYLVPFNDSCTLIVGYKGLIELIYRNDKIAKIFADVVYQGDDFEYQHGTEEYLKHTPCNDSTDEKDLCYAYCYVKFINGESVFRVLNRKQINHARKSSKTANIWNKHPAAMWMKTAVRSISNFLPLSHYERKIVESEEMITQIDDYDENGIKPEVFENPEKNLVLNYEGQNED